MIRFSGTNILFLLQNSEFHITIFDYLRSSKITIFSSESKLHIMESTCRICLEEGASLPIFQEDVKFTIRTKMSVCLHEEVEEVIGYPRNICHMCNSTLDVIYKFLNTYKESCRILESGLRSEVKLQNISETEIMLEEAEVLSESDLTLAHIKLEFDLECDQAQLFEDLAKKVKPTKKRLKKEKHIQKKRIKKEEMVEGKGKKVRGNGKTIRTNSVASSLLEGVYCWSGMKWSFVSRTPTEALLPAVREDTRRKCRTLVHCKRKQRVKSDPKRLCDLCGTVFADQTKLTKHKKKVHGGIRFKCNEAGCTKTCNTEFNLLRHQARRHGTKRDHICSTCGATFAFRAELTHHAKRHDSSYKRKMFSCSMCDKTYKTRKSVDIHERSVHTGLRPATCTECSAAFFHEDYLKEHMRLHTGETPFACPVCGRGYAQRANMKSHLRSHRLTELDATMRESMRPNYLKLLKL